MKKQLLLAILLCLAVGCYFMARWLLRPPSPPPVVGSAPKPPEPLREWSFVQNDSIQIQSGGVLSVNTGGTILATYLRTDGTNVVVKLVDGSSGAISMNSLAEDDLSYLAGLGGLVVDEGTVELIVLERKLAMARKSGNEAAAALYRLKLDRTAAERWDAQRRAQLQQAAKEKAIADARDEAELQRLRAIGSQSRP
jgi:hypothetical protein